MAERNVYLEDIPLDEARARLRSHAREAGAGRRCRARPWLPEALGRITAEPVRGQTVVPHYHSAAMDGYGFRRDTLNATETRLVTLRIGRAGVREHGRPLPLTPTP
jgi:putative molybdopterin biosynthesis protein